MIAHIEHEGTLYALIVRNGFKATGVRFFTPNEAPQQLAYISHGKGKLIPPHTHNLVHREIEQTQEILIVKSGRMRVDFYTEEAVYFESRVIEPWDILFLARGGHGFEILEPIEMIEIKQGPYAGTEDKTIFGQGAPETIVLKPETIVLK
ncbi:MAG: hypothetical protein HQL74_15685 [Magnetococcales bacterium]|nr:hypothetical protein [Magnetococcales bacterium]